jgi:hypothetical protein
MILTSYLVGVGNTALGFVGTCLSWPLMTYVCLSPPFINNTRLTPPVRPPHNLQYRRIPHDPPPLHNRLPRPGRPRFSRNLGPSNSNGHLDLHLPANCRTHLLRHHLGNLIHPSPRSYHSHNHRSPSRC